MKEDLPEIDLITVNYNGVSFLKDFFRSLNELNYPKDKLRVFFIDNNSKDGSVNFVKQTKVNFKLQIIRNNKNYGFAKANNMVFPHCQAEYIALLNNDTRVDRNWLIKLVEKMESEPSIGIADSRRIPTETPRYIDSVTQETSWCSGGSCLIRRSMLEKIGYFDEKFFMYGEDNDLSWRMWIARARCVYVPESICEHHFGKPEKYQIRRIYYHVRNSILLRYTYGSSISIRLVYIRYLKEGLSLAFKKHRFEEAIAVFGAIIGHIPYIFYFKRKKKVLSINSNFKKARDKWIRI